MSHPLCFRRIELGNFTFAALEITRALQKYKSELHDRHAHTRTHTVFMLFRKTSLPRMSVLSDISIFSFANRAYAFLCAKLQVGVESVDTQTKKALLTANPIRNSQDAFLFSILSA